MIKRNVYILTNPYFRKGILEIGMSRGRARQFLPRRAKLGGAAA